MGGVGSVVYAKRPKLVAHRVYLTIERGALTKLVVVALIESSATHLPSAMLPSGMHGCCVAAERGFVRQFRRRAMQSCGDDAPNGVVGLYHSIERTVGIERC